MRIHPLRLAALVSLGLVAACASEDPATEQAATARDACREIQREALSARRDAFGQDYARAERGFRRIIALYGEGDNADRCLSSITPAQAQMNLGLILSNQLHYRLADGAFEKARTLLDDRQDDISRQDRAQLDVYLSHHALNRNAPQDARRFAEDALRVLRLARTSDTGLLAGDELFGIDADTQNRRLAEAQTLYALGFADLSDAKLDVAEQRSIDALKILDTLPATTKGMRSRFRIQQALAFLGKGQWKQASLTAGQAAEDLAQELPNSPLEARAHLIDGTALAQDGRVAEADEAFARSFAVYEETPVALRYESIWPYIRFITQRHANGDLTKQEMGERIFRASQLVRSPFTAFDISATAALFEAGASDAGAAVRDWRAAQEKLSRLRAAQARTDQLLPDQIRQLERQAADAADDEERLRARRDDVAPQYAAALNAPASLADIQAELGEDEALIQILTGSPRSTVIYIEKNDIEVRTLGLDNAFYETFVGALRQSFEPTNGRYRQFNAEAAFVLQRAIFADLIDRVRERDHVFVSASGVLQSLPFELLVVEDPVVPGETWTQEDYRGIRWLDDEVQISYLPSPRNLVDIRVRAGQSKAEKPLIAFGDFVSNVSTETVLRTARLPEECAPEASIVASLPPLPGTAAEIDRIARALGTGPESLVTNASFTEEAVQERAASGTLDDYQVVHFATHGLLWQTEDCFTEPSLVTSAALDGASDGLLTSSEIRQLSLDAQLVVLSACDTAGGGTLGIGGESLAGLARAFFSSGSRAVAASHWKVDDEAAISLMGRMYEGFGTAGARQNFGAALKASRRAYRQEAARSHPAFWAPFVIIGDGRLGLNLPADPA
ncbi:MAG: CHAT domain-containing protein [Pseudomonadota bacterium]